MLITEELKKEITQACHGSARMYSERLHFEIPEEITNNTIEKLLMILTKIRVMKKGEKPRYATEKYDDDETIMTDIADTVINNAVGAASSAHTKQFEEPDYFKDIEDARLVANSVFSNGFVLNRINNTVRRLCTLVEMGAPKIILLNESRMLFEAALLVALTETGDISLSEAQCAYTNDWLKARFAPTNHMRDLVKTLQQKPADKSEEIIAGLKSQIATLKNTIESERKQSAMKIAKLDKENRLLDHKVDELIKKLDRVTLLNE